MPVEPLLPGIIVLLMTYSSGFPTRELANIVWPKIFRKIMMPLGANTDPVFVKPTHYSKFDTWLLKAIRDERDLPFLHLTIKITLTLLPLAVICYLPGVNGWWFAAAVIAYHYFNNFAYKGPFGLMLHCTSHRPLFKKEYGWMNHYLPWVIAPFFGHSPETYYAHHIGMHHAENNLEEDESSTMPFQRDSLGDWARYFASFLFVGIYHLCSYHFRKKRQRLLMRSVRGELTFFAFCVVMSFVSWQATFFVFILPFFLYRLVAMMGNWAQHAFIDASDPGNHFKNSITCINTKYNWKCWNDGYHISHHVKQTMHWTEHPVSFRNNIQEYVANDAIVFDGIHFLHVYIWLMRKRYDLLAKHFVNLGNRFVSDEEVISFLKSRTKKISFDDYRVPPSLKEEAVYATA